MFLNPISEVEVINLVSAHKNKTSIYSNDINMVVIKMLYKYNTTHHYGNIKKIILITPDQYLCCASFPKSFKKLYNNRLEQLIDNNNVLSNSQYGFRPSMSTSHALLDLVEEISISFDKKKHTLGVFVDLKKAFNRVNHSILI